MATIKKCDICKKKATSGNPVRNIRIYSHMDVINGQKVYRQVDADVCLDCRNELNDIISVIEYDFCQNKLYTEVKDVVYPTTGYTEVEEPTGSPVENGWYVEIDGEYVLSEDTEVDPETTYFIKVTTEGDNPVEKGWYEKVDGIYQLSEDEVANEDTTYYEKIKECDCK